MKIVMNFKQMVHDPLLKQCERFQDDELSFIDATDNAKNGRNDD